MAESEIAEELLQSIISRDIKVIKELLQKLVFDLAKSDLAYYYKQCIDGIEEAVIVSRIESLCLSVQNRINNQISINRIWI